MVWYQFTNCLEMVGSYLVFLARNKVWLHSHERIMGAKVSRFRDVLFDFPYINLLFGPRNNVYSKDNGLCFVIFHNYGNTNFLEINIKKEIK